MNVTELYHHVIEDVVKSLKSNCTSEEEDLLQQLQSAWESNLLRSGVIGGSSSVSRFSSSDDVDEVNKGLTASIGTPLNPNEEENVKLSSSFRRSIPSMVGDLGLPSTSLQTQVETIYPAIVDESHRPKFPEGNPPFKFQPTLPSVVCLDGKPLPFMPPAPKINHFQESIKRIKKKPKTDTFIEQYDGLEGLEAFEGDVQDATANTLNDDEFAEMFAENGKEEEEDIEPLNSDLDDKEESELETSNLVLCQFEKISRSKNKRKCKLKDGIMHLDGKDYVFSEGVGECEF